MISKPVRGPEWTNRANPATRCGQESASCEIVRQLRGVQPTLGKQDAYRPVTPGSMNSLFGNFFREFWRGILGGVRDYLGMDLGRFVMEV